MTELEHLTVHEPLPTEKDYVKELRHGEKAGDLFPEEHGDSVLNG
jgi:hypothetical protein